MAALFAVMMLFVAGACSSGSSNAKKTSTDTANKNTSKSSDSSSKSDSSDTSSSDTSSDTSSGASSDTFSDTFTDTGSSSSRTSGFCLAVTDIKKATKDINAANTSRDDTQYKSAIAEGTRAFQDLAAAAPSSQRTDAKFIANAWTKFNSAVQSTSPGDPSRETARQEFKTANDGPEVKTVDSYINRTC